MMNKEENEKFIETYKKYFNSFKEIKAYYKSCENGLQPQKKVNYIGEILENEDTKQ